MTLSGSNEHILGSSPSSTANSALTTASDTPSEARVYEQRLERKRYKLQEPFRATFKRSRQKSSRNQHHESDQFEVFPHEIESNRQDRHKHFNQHQMSFQNSTSKPSQQRQNDVASSHYDRVAPDSPSQIRLQRDSLGGEKKMVRKTNRSNSKSNHNNNNSNNNRSTSSLNRPKLKNWLILGLFAIGLIVCLTSLACLLLLPTFVSQQISRKLVLKNGSMLLERWSKPNVPMYFKVWIYNVKNAQELVSKRGARPQVEEIGPFVFNLKRQKDVISFSGENLYYTERKIYKFNRELSCCALNTTVTIPNIPLVAVVDRAMSYNLPLVGRFIPRLINRAIQSLREPMFVRKQANEILFDGYDVELLKMVSRIGSLVGLPQQSQRFGILKGRNDTWRPEQDGVWAINTGQRDRRLFGRVSSWNSYRKLPFWSQSQCNVINGSDGTLFPPPIKNSQPLYIFNQELCRTVNLVYDRPSDVRSIQAYRFVLNPLNFAHTMSSPVTGGAGISSGSSSLVAPSSSNAARANIVHRPLANSAVGRTNPVVTQEASRVSTPPKRNQNQLLEASSSERQTTTTSATGSVASLNTNEQEELVREAQRASSERHKQMETPMNPQTCFCDRKTTNLNGINVCEFDGLIDLSKCSKQAQVIFGSMPHFYNSDPRLLRQVDGMTPNATKHTTYLDIEPNTGLVLGGKRRVQLNLIVKRNNEIDGFENINDMLVPVVWFEESAMIPEEAAKKFKSMYTDRIRMINLTLLSLFIASLALLAIDLRLMINTHYWRGFKIFTPSSTLAGDRGEDRFRPKSGLVLGDSDDILTSGQTNEADEDRDQNNKTRLEEHKSVVVIQAEVKNELLDKARRERALSSLLSSDSEPVNGQLYPGSFDIGHNISNSNNLSWQQQDNLVEHEQGEAITKIEIKY